MKSTAMDRLPRKVRPETAVVRTSPAAKPISGSPSTPWRRLLIAAGASAFLLWLAYFPVAWGWLGWIALVPLLTLVRSPARPRAVYLVAWLSGLCFFWPVLQWMRVADWRMYFTW